MAPSTELMEITEPTALFEPTAVAEPTMDIGSTAATDTSMATDTTETAEPAASTEKFRKRDKKPELSQVQRASIIQALANGEPVAKIAKDFGIARTTVYHTKKRFRERGDLASQPRTGRPAKRLKHFMAMHDYQPPPVAGAATINGGISKSTPKRVTRSQSAQKNRHTEDSTAATVEESG